MRTDGRPPRGRPPRFSVGPVGVDFVSLATLMRRDHASLVGDHSEIAPTPKSFERLCAALMEHGDAITAADLRHLKSQCHVGRQRYLVVHPPDGGWTSVREYQKAWDAKNRELRRAKKRAWARERYRRLREELLAKGAAWRRSQNGRKSRSNWYWRNRERILSAGRQRARRRWAQSPDIAREKQRHKRALRTPEQRDRERAYQRDYYQRNKARLSSEQANRRRSAMAIGVSR